MQFHVEFIWFILFSIYKAWRGKVKINKITLLYFSFFFCIWFDLLNYFSLYSIPRSYLILHHDFYVSIVIDFILFMSFSCSMLSSSTRWAVSYIDSAILAIKLWHYLLFSYSVNIIILWVIENYKRVELRF